MDDPLLLLFETGGEIDPGKENDKKSGTILAMKSREIPRARHPFLYFLTSETQKGT